MQLDVADLLATPLLAPLGARKLGELLAAGALRGRQCRAGQLLHAEGEACTALELIISGQLAVERIDEDGNLMTIATFGPGDCIGGNLLFSSDPVHRMAVTAVGSLNLVSIGRESLLHLFMENQAFLRSYLRVVADNAVLLEAKLKYYVNLPVRQRILNFLSAQQRLQGSRHILLPASKKALAAQLGMQRSSFSRELQRMREEGLIAFDRGSISWL